MVKNLFEMKAARRVTIEGNIFENCWGQRQAGYAIVFTVRAQGGVMPVSCRGCHSFATSFATPAAASTLSVGTTMPTTRESPEGS